MLPLVQKIFLFRNRVQKFWFGTLGSMSWLAQRGTWVGNGGFGQSLYQLYELISTKTSNFGSGSVGSSNSAIYVCMYVLAFFSKI